MTERDDLPEFPAAYAMLAFACPVLAVVAPLGLAPMGLGLGILALVAGHRVGMTARYWLGWLALPALVCLWGAISALWAVDPGRALSSSFRLLAIAITGLATVAVLPRLTPRSARAVGIGLASSIILAAAILTVEYLSGNRLTALAHELRGLKPFPDGAKSQLNRGATVMAVILWPTALLVARFHGRRAAVALIAFATCSLLVGDSLAARLALIVGGAVAALHYALPVRGILRWSLVAATLAIPFGAQFLPPPPTSWEMYPNLPLSAHQRLGIWNFAGTRAAEHPLLGWGLDASRAIPGGDEELFINRMAPAGNVMWTLTGQRLPLHPHNAFLQWGLELGLVGSVLMAAVLWRLGGYAAAIAAPGARAAATGALAAAATISAVSYGFWQSWWLVTLWLTAALCALASGAKAEDFVVKILFLTENFPPETNAAATRVFERAVYWARWGHEVTVLTCAPNFPGGKVFPGWENRWRQVETMDGMRVVRVKTYISANEGFAKRTADFISFMASAYLQGLREERPDVVVATSPQFFAAIGGWALAATRRLPFVFELGDLWPRSITAVGAMRPSPIIRALEKLELFLYRRSAAVAALTHAFKTNLTERGIDPAKIAVVINGVDLPRYAPRPRDAELAAAWGLEGKTVIGYVGTHGMAHGLINVLDAAERSRDDERLRYLFVGAGAERQMLMDEAARRGLPNLVFAPMQPKEMMPRVWSLCDVALVHLKDSPAFAEVIPSKIFEAMGMGLPILLAAPEGEASRILLADGAGLWVPAACPDDLAQAAQRLMTDDALRHRCAAASLAAAPTHSREHQADRMLKVLELAAAGRGRHDAGGIES